VKMPITLKLFLTYALLGLILCVFGVATAGDREMQAILQPIGTAHISGLIVFLIVWIWQQ
jgi:hypothetical protein